MSGFKVMAGFAAGATLAGMVVGVARLTETVEPATAVAETPAATKAPAPSGPPVEEPPPRWHAPEGAPEEVTAGVLAKVASRRAEAERGCRTSREPAATEKRGRKGARAEKAARCPPEEGIESVEIDWNGPPATR
ncbi:hypothetical protein [Anaeromyxobacter terrae]|uniref:hypothetical protein n=1 Tax=Anaeromyxobacter terrae TaxID=2925406 RepID=UPI001F5798AB|nr:hypothetical protein [Anaeromyxobacter sp. SG22]